MTDDINGCRLAEMASGMPESVDRQRWDCWLEFVRRKAFNSLTPDQGVETILEYMGCREPGGPGFPTAVLNALGVRMPSRRRRRNTGTSTDSGLFGVRPVTDLSGPWYQPEVHVNDTRPPRRVFTAAHELGHVLLYSISLQSQTGEQLRQHCQSEEWRENFCEVFAARLTGLGSHVDNRNGEFWQDVESTMSPTTVQQAREAQDVTKCFLTFQHLCALAGTRHWSIRRTIAWLDGNPMLDVVEAGIAVLRVGPNRYRGSHRALRVWQTAVPSWGFMASNQRASSAGFSAAEHAFEHVDDRKLWPRKESLSVKENCRLLGLASRRKFRERLLDTTCGYVPVDVKDEGRYLLVIWSWSREQTEPDRQPLTGPE